MATIVVIDPSHVTLDGIPAGSVLDVPENHASIEGIKGLALDALLAWDAARTRANAAAMQALRDQHKADLESLHKDCEAAKVDALAAQSATHDEAVAKLGEKQARQVTDLNARVADQDATIASQQAQIDALGGTELGRKLATEARLKAAMDAKAKAEAEIASLS